MGAEIGAEDVLQALPEPALIVGTDGKVVFANGAALMRLGATQSLTTLSPASDALANLRDYLVRCSGSRSPLIGAVTLRDSQDETRHFRSQGSLLAPAQGDIAARVLLRLAEGKDSRFSVLGQKIRDLNEEIRTRRRTQALLEKALRDRELLLRELHHRVKNNIQMLAGLLYAARHETTGRDAALILGEASQRLAAIGAVHQMLYVSDHLLGVRGDEFVAGVGGAIMEALGAREHFTYTAEPIEIPNDSAAPLALILNELLTNAVKHGCRADGKPSRVHASLSQAVDTTFELSVKDEGPGIRTIDLSGPRTSGMGLVRGLARQLSGSLSVGHCQTGGACCAVRFQPHRGQ